MFINIINIETTSVGRINQLAMVLMAVGIPILTKTVGVRVRVIWDFSPHERP